MTISTPHQHRKMIQTETDRRNDNERNSLSSFSWTDVKNLSSSNDIETSEDDQIDWEFVAKQLESKLQTSFQSPLNNSSQISRKGRYRPLPTNNQLTESYTKKKILLTASPFPSVTSTEKQLVKKYRLDHQTEKNIPTFSSRMTLDELLRELTACQEKQVSLLDQIDMCISRPEQISSLAFFLPFDSRRQTIPSLQDAFQQRKSFFIDQSKERVQQIYRRTNRRHQRIIPDIKQSTNTYLQERRKHENDRLCAMIIKHQNRQNAKIYGNLIKNQMCHH